MDGMTLAIDEARKALAEGEIPVGAVLMRGNEVLWADHNRREQNHDPSAHAEMLCLSNGAKVLGDWRLQDCTLWVTLEPCPMCAGALVMSRVGRCIFSIPDPEKGCCGSVYDLPADPALGASCVWEQAASPAEAAECRELLRACFQQRRSDK